MLGSPLIPTPISLPAIPDCESGKAQECLDKCISCIKCIDNRSPECNKCEEQCGNCKWFFPCASPPDQRPKPSVMQGGDWEIKKVTYNNGVLSIKIRPPSVRTKKEIEEQIKFVIFDIDGMKYDVDHAELTHEEEVFLDPYYIRWTFKSYSIS